MRVAVLGAGVVGITTAYYLTQSGHSVTVIDREPEVANATSFANAAQLCYSFTDSLASPAFALKFPALFAGVEPSILIRPPINSQFLRWAFNFLMECTASKASRNTLHVLQLALRSSELMDQLLQSVRLQFSFRRCGKLILLSTRQEKANAIRACSLKSDFGCKASVIGLDDAIDIEPEIRHMTGNYVGAIYSHADAVGDARAFTDSLAARLQQSSECDIRLNTPIKRIISDNQKVQGVETSEGTVNAEAIVVCLGPWSSQLLKSLGIDPGIYPVRGYSMTLPPGRHSPSVSVTDLGRRFVMCRIGERMRISGLADIVGFNTKRDKQRINDLLTVVRQNAPGAANYDVPANSAWAGFRPMTVSGRPVTGGTSVEGLYLNTGHGTLGWTLACVTGHDIAREVSGDAALTPAKAL